MIERWLKIMLFPIIYVKDKEGFGDAKIIGTNVHHSLTLCDGNLQFINLQCFEGTGEDGCYEFTNLSEENEVRFVNFLQLMDIYKENVGISGSKFESEWDDLAFQLKNLLNKLDSKKREAKEKLYNDIASLYLKK